MKSPTVESIMHTTPATVTPEDTLATAQDLMQRHGAHQLPVVEGERLVGILSERDLHAHIGYFERTKVDAAMTVGASTLPLSASAVEAARMILEHKVHAVPIVDGELLVGIVSTTDLLTLLVHLLEEGAA